MRIAESDCKVHQTEYLRNSEVIPGRAGLTLIRSNVQKYVSVRGEQLRRIRLRRALNQKHDELLRDPSQAFGCIKPDADPPLAALKRDDGAVTGNISEMDVILRKKWGSIFCKHNEGNPHPETFPFMERYSRLIEDYPMELERIGVSDIRSRLNPQPMQRLRSYWIRRVVSQRLQKIAK